MRVNKTLDQIGRFLIHAGILILLFAGYQLWGTGLIEHRAQDNLEKEFVQTLKKPTPKPKRVSADEGPPAPPTGDAVARIRIPKIGVDKIVVQGVEVYDLKRGPGHYIDTPLPGQKGNAAIAGHRTTYGAPFFRLDETEIGDVIYVTTREGKFEYRVKEKKIVAPSALEVLNDFGDNRLTLTTCNPKFSAATRLIVVSSLEGKAKAPSPPPKKSNPEPKSDINAAPNQSNSSLSGDSVPKAPAIAWGILAAACYFAIRVGLRKWKRIPTLLIGIPIFGVVLFIFFENFSRLLPANV